MKAPIIAVWLVWVALLVGLPAEAQRGHSGRSYSSSPRSSGSVHVHGYTSRSGKTVQPYMRRAPGTATHEPKVAAPRSAVRAPRSSSPGTPRLSAPRPTPSPRIAGGPHGRIKRNEGAKDRYMRETGHPHGWPGHVVDHRVPLACGGADAPSNMQWQTVGEAKAKDKVERQGCGRH